MNTLKSKPNNPKTAEQRQALLEKLKANLK